MSRRNTKLVQQRVVLYSKPLKNMPVSLIGIPDDIKRNDISNCSTLRMTLDCARRSIMNAEAKVEVLGMPMMGAVGLWWIFPLFGMGVMGFFAWMLFFRTRNPGHRYINPPDTRPDPLETARERYAQGLISKEEFDHIAERLVRTERRP